jgi:hypothetical protein
MIGKNNISTLAETTALIAAMTNKPTAARQSLINYTIYNLKKSGFWARIDKLLVFACHSNDAGEALLDWKNPSLNPALAVNAPTFTIDRGFTGDGASSYVNTKFTPSTQGVNYQLLSASYIYWFLNPTANYCSAGASAASIDNRYYDTYAAMNSTGIVSIANYDKSGFKGATRTDNTQFTVFDNLTSTIATSSTSASLSAREQWVLCNNSTSKTYSNNTIALICYGGYFTNNEMLMLRTIFGDYLTEIGTI